MPASPWFLTVVYVLGVAWCLLMSDARAVDRVVLAILWPLGPIAIVVTVGILLIASAVAYPMIGVPLLVGIALVVWWALF